LKILLIKEYWKKKRITFSTKENSD